MSYLTMIPAETVEVNAKTMHQTVMGYFPANLPGAAAERRATTNILFAADDRSLLIRSDIAPTRAPATAVTRVSPDAPTAGTVIRFRVTVNAVRRGHDGGTTPVLDLNSWLETRLSPALTDVTVLRHTRSTTHTGRSALQMDRVDGQAVVADSAALESVLRAGVGRGKAYGCGLMLVAA